MQIYLSAAIDHITTYTGPHRVVRPADMM